MAVLVGIAGIAILAIKTNKRTLSISNPD